jgi:Bacterial alpha-L-rhamnosidase 6 hairpin glycosidase domain
MRCLVLAIYVCCLLFPTACDTPDKKSEINGSAVQNEYRAWPEEGPQPEFSHPLFERIPQLKEISPYFLSVDTAGDIPEAADLSAFAVGNGYIFAIAGLTLPLATLHEIVGPTYQKRDRYFSDVEFTFLVDGEPASCSREWLARPQNSSVLITVAECESANFYTVTFAPQGESDERLEKTSLIRLVLTQNNSTSDLELGYRACSASLPENVTATTESIIEIVVERDLPPLSPDGRSLTLRSLDDRPAAVAESCLEWSASTAAGASDQTVFALISAAGDSSSIIEAVEQLDVEATLVDTLSYWVDLDEQGVQLSATDEKATALYSALRYSIAVQQSFTGAISPMSLYTSTWTRDTIGPVKFFLASGLHDRAKSMLDYHYRAVVTSGDYFNAFDNDRLLDNLPDEPDWESLPEGGGRTRAEGPSYVALMYDDYYRWTGDLEMIRERYGYIKRGVDIQQIDENGLLQFSDDETFRVAMALAFSLPMEGYFSEYAYSANSSFLYVRAAEIVANFAELLGYGNDADYYREQADSVRAATDSLYLTETGFYAPYLDIETGEQAPAPFEDVSTKPLWTGYLAPDDPKATDNLRATVDAIWREDGMLQSQIADSYNSFFGDIVEFGVHTGMTPGFALDNLARTFHPLAEDAFNALDLVADSSGNYAEYMVYDDHSALQLIYDSSGTMGDYTGRFRPWEGGINGTALLRFLLGIEPDAANKKLRLAPQLPNGWSGLTAEKVTVGQNTFRIEVSQNSSGLSVTVTNEGPDDFTIGLSLRTTVRPSRASVAGQSGTGSDISEVVFGGYISVYEDLSVSSGNSTEWQVAY